MSRRKANLKKKNQAARNPRGAGPSRGSSLAPVPLAAVAAAPLVVGQAAAAHMVEPGHAAVDSFVAAAGRVSTRDGATPPFHGDFPEANFHEANFHEGNFHEGNFHDSLQTGDPPDSQAAADRLRPQLFSALELDFFKRADDLYAESVTGEAETWEDLEPQRATTFRLRRAH